MPRLINPVAPVDGRQSETALFIARGTRRLLRAKGFSSVAEMPLQSGRRADLVALALDGTIHIVEIKSSVADFRADTKWRDYALHCDKLFFAISAEVPPDIMPREAGLIIADAYGAEIVRDAPEHRMSGATRRAMLTRFAHTAAHRLHALSDPQVASLQPFA